jgi:hypothetical protein
MNFGREKLRWGEAPINCSTPSFRFPEFDCSVMSIMPLNLIYTFSILIFVREVMNNVSSAEKKVRDQRQIRVGVLETCED